MRKLATLLVVAITATFVLAACGDDDADSKSKLTALTSCPDGKQNREVSDGDTVEFCKCARCFILFTAKGGKKYYSVFTPDDGGNSVEDEGEMFQDENQDGEKTGNGSKIFYPSKSGTLTFLAMDENGNVIGKMTIKLVEKKKGCAMEWCDEECCDCPDVPGDEFVGLWSVDTFTELDCSSCTEGEAPEDCCEEFTIPGYIGECEVGLEGQLAVTPEGEDETNVGFVSGEMRMYPLCDTGYIAMPLLGEYMLKDDGNALVLYSFFEEDGSRMQGSLDYSEDKQSVTLTFWMPTPWGSWLPMVKLEMSKEGGVGECALGPQYGNCYSGAGCEDLLAGCVAQNVCGLLLWLDGEEEGSWQSSTNEQCLPITPVFPD